MEHIMDTSPLFHLHVHAPVMISRSQEESLNEDAVFLPLKESSPELIHCEAERGALEHLLRAGPAAFYSRLCEGRLGSFLSPEEVEQVSRWAEDYRRSEVLQESGGVGESGGAGERGSATQPFSVQYFPVHSDTPAPELELGWPEKHVWERIDQAMVYTNPPLLQAPHIREVVRRLLQGANTLIAIVTDRLTDSMVIRDLHHAASRGVPVYIILNQRSAQENFITDRLKHPNIKVRVAGGRVFLSRDGKMVVGELKENFILVDLESVVLGSYSLTWTDVHLHRQLITVLRGPVLQAFDREFRVIYAASMPVPDVQKPESLTSIPRLERSHGLYDSDHMETNTHISLLLQSPPSPPAPPPDSPIDWDSLGVTQWKTGTSEDSAHLPEEPPVYHRAEFHRQVEVSGELGTLGWQDGGEVYPSVTAEPGYSTDYHTMFRNVEKPERALYRRLAAGAPAEWEERRQTFRSRMGMMRREESGLFSHALGRDNPPRVDARLGDNTMPEEAVPWTAMATANQQKPLDDGYSTLNSILKRIGSRESSNSLQTREFKTTGSRSLLLDLSDKREDLPQTTKCGDQFPLTPAVALIKKRNDNIKAGLLKSPRAIIPRSFSFGLQRETWRSPLFRAQKNEEDK